MSLPRRVATSPAAVGGRVTRESTYMPTFNGPRNLQVCVKVDLEQFGEAIGTTLPGATVGISSLPVHAATRQRVAVSPPKTACCAWLPTASSPTPPSAS